MVLGSDIFRVTLLYLWKIWGQKKRQKLSGPVDLHPRVHKEQLREKNLDQVSHMGNLQLEIAFPFNNYTSFAIAFFLHS